MEIFSLYVWRTLILMILLAVFISRKDSMENLAYIWESYIWEK